MDNSFTDAKSNVFQRGKSLYVQARLLGGAPWGFTLKGGLEHGEALIISKVEEGGKADMLEHPLQMGDQVVIINDVELSGFRQEAISLVKGSYKTLWLTVRRECCPGPCCPEVCPTISPSSLSPSPPPPRHNRSCSGGVKLRIKNRRSEPASRPHSWHSTKLGDGLPDPSMMQISQGSLGAPWHPNYHSSASTTDLSGYEAGFLRKSPDQYSSRGSMESLDPPNPAYSSCHQLSASKSSNSIDHLHSKRDSAYSSFSTSSSIPEYLAAAPPFNSRDRERSCSMELMPQSRMSSTSAEGMQQADIRYVRTIYDPQQGVSEEHEVTLAALGRTGDVRSQPRGPGGASYRGSSSSSSSGGGSNASHRHSVGPLCGRSSCESLKGAPAPPMRSDSFAAIRNHERPSSWSSLEQARSLRALQKGSWYHSSGSVAAGKPSFSTEGQLHTVVEKSEENSPTTRPKQGFPQTSQSGRPMYPTSIYPVPPPEPHFAQMPTACPSSSIVYPALAKESRYTSHRETGRVGGGAGDEEILAVENGYQSNPMHGSSNPPHPGLPLLKSPHQGSLYHDQGLEEPHAKYRPHLQGSSERPPTHTTLGQERRDPYTPVQPRAEKPKYNQSPELPNSQQPCQEEEYCRQPEASSQGPTLPVPQAKMPQGQVAHSSSSRARGAGHPERQYSESSISPPLPSDQEHPLTRLENALAEVQRCASPENSISRSSQSHPLAERSVSVLERVNRFEKREPGKVRSLSNSQTSSYRPNHAPVGPKTSLSGMEDLQGMVDRRFPSSYSNSQAFSSACQEGYMDLYQRRASSDQAHHKFIGDSAQALQRSKSTYHLSEENRTNPEWKETLLDVDLTSTIQDSSFNLAYRDSLKDAQSKVLRSTSFRRRDLNPPPVPAKHLSLERKGPKTVPKPSQATSPHTPKERHMVTPDLPDRVSPPQLPSMPPVGPPLLRKGGRKRLTMEQKKRSYSEPENMHEVGVSDPETNPRQHFLIAEASVADRRKMFELVASRNAGPKQQQPTSSRPELRQMQQDAVAEYMKRKTGQHSESRPSRPHSAYIQPASSSTDSRSLSSTSSLASLQDPGFESQPRGNSARQTYTLPANAFGGLHTSKSHIEPHQQAVHQHRPYSRTPEPYWLQDRPAEADRLSSAPSPSPSLNLNLSLGPGYAHTSGSDAALSHLMLSQHSGEGGIGRGTPARTSGKSASAEDLLDRLESRPASQHIRSRSSPSVERFNQEFITSDLKSYGDLCPSSYSANRSVASVKPERPASASVIRPERYVQPQSVSQGNPVVMRRDRQRHGDRQRAQSATGLAASVGLPCPFSSPLGGNAPSGGLEWQGGDRLCLANIDAITFPSTPHGGALAQTPVKRPSLPAFTRQFSSDTSTSEETLKDFPSNGLSQRTMQQVAPKTTPPLPEKARPHARHQTTGTGTGTGHIPPAVPPKTSRMSPPSPRQAPEPTVTAESLPSLRISESALCISPTTCASSDDDVFLPPPPAPPSPPEAIRETDLTEDFPPPPPPLTLLRSSGEEIEAEPFLPPSAAKSLLSVETVEDSAIGSSSLSPPPLSPEPSLSPSLSSEPIALVTASDIEQEEEDESLDLDTSLLSRRERTEPERQVEALAMELVGRDKYLTSLLDGWSGARSSMNLMEELFPAYGEQSSRQRRKSSISQEDRRSDGANDSLEASSVSGRMETDLDEDDSDLIQKQGELLQALSESVAALKEEKEQLAEEQKQCSMLGSSTEALVQDCCKPNERDKYRMFIGDLDKIVNLLLSLNGRLARIESALATLDRETETEDSREEKESLQRKQRQLCSQQEDACELKENLDRRERVVLDFLSGYLTRVQLSDHRRYVRLKPALLIRQRHLDELIRLGQEHLQRLADTLPGQESTPSPATAPGPVPAPSSTSPPPGSGGSGPASPRSTAVTSL